MPALKSIPESLRWSRLAGLFCLIGLTTLHAAPSPGDTVRDPAGASIGQIESSLETEASPCYLVRHADGTRCVVAASRLREDSGTYVLSSPDHADVVSPEAEDTAFAIRSMSMVIANQQSDSMRFVSDISDMKYVLENDTLFIDGTLDNTDQVESFLSIAHELSDYALLPRIRLRES